MLLRTFLIVILVSAIAIQVFCQDDEDETKTAKFATCDFDLLAIRPEILQYLPEECQQVVAESEIYQKMLLETNRFVEYTDLLNQKEIDTDPNYYVDEDEGGIPEKLWDLRTKMYINDGVHGGGMFVCAEHLVQADYMDCLRAQREIMITKLQTTIN